MSEILVKDAGGATARMIDLGGYNTPCFPGKDATTLKTIVEDMPSFQMRDDDVMLCTFPKTGTNWLWDILAMMTRKTSKRVDFIKYMSMLEAQTPEDMDSLKSPRIMNSHLRLRFLPTDLKKKQIKTVLLLRNPKDVAVSYFNHMKGLRFYGYEGEWENWLPSYIKGQFEYGKYIDYLREWQEAIEKGVGFPLHLMYYEDMKMNGSRELDKLEKFLGIDLKDDLKRDIIDACSFDKLKAVRQADREKKSDLTLNKGYGFYRKGQVGDWKNWFTVQQNEEFDKIWKQQAGDIKFPFVYTGP